MSRTTSRGLVARLRVPGAGRAPSSAPSHWVDNVRTLVGGRRRARGQAQSSASAKPTSSAKADSKVRPLRCCSQRNGGDPQQWLLGGAGRNGWNPSRSSPWPGGGTNWTWARCRALSSSSGGSNCSQTPNSIRTARVGRGADSSPLRSRRTIVRRPSSARGWPNEPRKNRRFYAGRTRMGELDPWCGDVDRPASARGRVLGRWRRRSLGLGPSSRAWQRGWARGPPDGASGRAAEVIERSGRELGAGPAAEVRVSPRGGIPPSRGSGDLFPVPLLAVPEPLLGAPRPPSGGPPPPAGGDHREAADQFGSVGA